jgi:hypothetical protein
MGTKDADDNPLEDARELARAHRLFIVEVSDRVRGKYVRGWVVYRKTGEGCRPARLGRRRDPAALLGFVRLLTAEPVHA